MVQTGEWTETAAGRGELLLTWQECGAGASDPYQEMGGRRPSSRQAFCVSVTPLQRGGLVPIIRVVGRIGGTLLEGMTIWSVVTLNGMEHLCVCLSAHYSVAIGRFLFSPI